jgi:hypothetical protein
MRDEITDSTEWTCFNDNMVSTMADNWYGLLEQCVEMATYPTVLFYEKLDPNEEYEKSKGFNLNDKDISDLHRWAEKMNLQHSANVEDMFSQDEIARQIQIERELLANKKEATDLHEKPVKPVYHKPSQDSKEAS